MIKLLLVKPFQKANEIQPPLGLGYLASAVKDIAEVTILDCIKEDLPTEKFLDYFKDKQFDLVGYQCYTVDLNTVKELSRLLRKKYPDIMQLVGGPQPSLEPKNTLNYLNEIDYGIMCEGEVGLYHLLKILSDKPVNLDKLKDIPGLIYRSNENTYANEASFTEDLDNYDPSWHLFDLKNYPLAPHGAFCKQSPTAPLIITRGCPFQCTYCGGPIISGRKIRRHSVDYVMQQIKLLKEKYGIKEIHIEDDNFTMNKEYAMDLCDRIIKANLGMTFAVPNGIRLDTLDSELIRTMKRAGFYSLSVGIESGSDRIRELMKKNLDTKTIIEKVNLIRQEGLEIIGFFIVGFPGESKKDINSTIDLACKLDLKRATFSAYKPFPGTPSYYELVKQGKIKKIRYENFSLDKVAWSPEGISNKELKDLRRKAFIKFYGRPKILLKMLAEIKNWQNLKFILRRIVRWMN